MDNGTNILLFNVWAILLGLFLLRSYQSRSVRLGMIRQHNRAVVWRARFGRRLFRILKGVGNLWETSPPAPVFRLLRRGRGRGAGKLVEKDQT